MGRVAPDEWSFYFPDDGQTKADAIPIIGRIFAADDAAQEACEYDFSSRDGWEHGETTFSVVVISPTGTEARYEAWHEPSVEHRVRPSP